MQGPQATPRAVLLGASNLTASLPVVVDLARAALGAPLHIHAALGRGRSYGMRSSFLVRAMPGIGECALWPALARDPGGPTSALLCDIGNDLAFGVPAPVIAGWIETALDRLEPTGARTVLATLPLSNLRAMAPWKFELFRRLLFPGHRIERPRLLAEAERLDARLREVARARGAHVRDLDASWYGVDPIHFARAERRRAWSTLLGPWMEPGGNGGRAPAPGRGLDWRSELLAPAERSILGIALRRTQPCARLADGTQIHLY